MVFKRNGSWYITYQEPATGRWRKKKSGPDKALAEQHQAQERRKRQAAIVGLYNPVEKHLNTPIAHVVEKFLEDVESRDPGPDHVLLLASRLYTALDWMQVEYVRDISDGAPRLDDFLKALRAGRVTNRSGIRVTGRDRGGVSPKTRDEYGASLRQLGRWMEQEQLVARNPFPLKRTKVEGEETFTRRAITMDEVHRLCEAACRRLRTASGEGRRLACLYYCAATTGMRRGELKKLKWAHVDISEGYITLPADVTKNKRKAILPMNAKLRDMMFSLLLEDPKAHSGAPVFFVPVKTAEMLRKDAKLAGIEDKPGTVLDFHCLRTSCATNLLRAGVRPDVVQMIMRHSDIRITIDHYRKEDRDEMLKAVEELV